jgi:hypothetical protein
MAGKHAPSKQDQNVLGPGEYEPYQEAGNGPAYTMRSKPTHKVCNGVCSASMLRAQRATCASPAHVVANVKRIAGALQCLTLP